MTKIISLFNNKGGVSKTTTTFHLGWKLAELGYKTLIVDTDPQCNLTGLCLNSDKENKLSNFYRKNGHNLKEALSPVFDNKPEPLRSSVCYKMITKIFYYYPVTLIFLNMMPLITLLKT